MSRIYPILLVSIFASSAVAAEEGPDYPYVLIAGNVSSKNFDALTANCDRIGKEKITCNFTQTMIKPKIDKEELDKMVEEYASARKAEIEANGDETWAQGTDKLCTSDAIQKAKDEVLNGSGNEGQKRWAIETLDALKQACDVKDEASFRATQRAIFERELTHCTVFNNQFSLDFTYNYSSKQWLSQTAPSGACGIINITSLYKSPGEEEGLLWTYEQQRVITDKKGEGPFGLCKDRDTAPMKYETGEGGRYIHCELITYGF